jgi:hypothetical protein
MGRSHGRRGTKDCRTPEIDPDSAEARDIGMSDRELGTPSPIPGGELHLTNHQTMRQSTPTAEPRPEFRGVMAHGVPAEKHTAHERADAMRGPNSAKDPRPAPAPGPRGPHTHPVPPVPVVIVSEGRDTRPLRTSSHRRYQVPVAGTEPIRLVGRNSQRVQLLMLNEDATHNIRFGQTMADLNQPSSGTVLPATTSSYLKFETQDELYAVSDDDSAPFISIIEVFDRPNSEVQ